MSVITGQHINQILITFSNGKYDGDGGDDDDGDDDDERLAVNEFYGNDNRQQIINYDDK